MVLAMEESVESDWFIDSVNRCLFYMYNKLRLGAFPLRVLLISAPYLYKRHPGARNLAD